jgi:hypothetical protein
LKNITAAISAKIIIPSHIIANQVIPKSICNPFVLSRQLAGKCRTGLNIARAAERAASITLTQRKTAMFATLMEFKKGERLL